MKKINKFVMTFVTFLLVLAGLAPLAKAQELDVVSILTEISKANQTIESFSGDFKFTGTAESEGKQVGDLNLDGTIKLNVGDNPAFQADINTAGTFNGETMENRKATVTIVDGVAYAYDGTSWQVQDVSKEQDSVIASIKDSEAKAASQDAAVIEKFAKYYDVEDSGDAYVVRLKKDIDAEAFMADLGEGVDIQAIKDQAIAEAEKTAPLSDQERQMIDSYFNMGIKLAFSAIDNLEIHYDKETYKVTKIILSVKADEKMISDALGLTPEDLGTTFNGQFNFEMNLGNYGQDSDIQVPEGAPTFDPAAAQSGAESETESVNASTEGADGDETNGTTSGEESSADASSEASVEETTVTSAE